MARTLQTCTNKRGIGAAKQLRLLRQQNGTCVFGDVVEQQGVFGESLHLDGNDVFELESATLTVTLGLLRKHTADLVR